MSQRPEQGAKNEYRKLDAIPMPKIIRDATISIPENPQYVSHKVTNGDPEKDLWTGQNTVFLTADNSGFYIGKVFPLTPGQKIARLLGWSTREEDRAKAKQSKTDEDDNLSPRIYSEEVIEASLAYLFKHIKYSEKGSGKITYVIGRHLSAIINGQEDLKGALTTEEEIALIRKICRKKFPSYVKDLQIVLVENMPEHHALFQSLQEKYDPVLGRADADAVLSQKPSPLGPKPTSLEIARALYHATRQNDMLALRFRATVPSKLKQNSDDETVRRAQNYGIIEVATRLADILGGRYIQGGADRQAVYDDIIIHILQGPKGKFRKVEGLQELLKLFEGKRFETLHLDTRENPSVLEGIRSRARTRLAIIGISLAAAATGIYKLGEMRERSRHEAVQSVYDKALAQDLRDVDFYHPDNLHPASSEYKVETFHEISRKITIHLEDRYDLPSNAIPNLQQLVEQFLRTRKNYLNSLQSEAYLRIWIADEFVRHYSSYLISQGVHLTEPYAKLAAAEQFIDQLPLQKIQTGTRITYQNGNLMYPKENPNVKILGVFHAGSSTDEESSYLLAVYTEERQFVGVTNPNLDAPLPDNRYLVAAKTSNLTGFSHKNYFEETIFLSSQAARQAICHLRRDRLYYEADKFYSYLPLFQHLQDNNSTETIASDSSSLTPIGTYHVESARRQYDLAIYDKYLKTENGVHFSGKMLVAKYPNESTYSVRTAKEVAAHFFFAQKTRESSYQDCQKVQ